MTILIVCLFIIAGGATLPQRLAGMTNVAIYSFPEAMYGVLTAGLLIFTSVGWFLWSASRRKDRWYRRSGIELGLALLIVAGLAGIYIGSDKRAAINHIVFILAPLFMALLLVQLLNSAARIKILLYTIAALGCVNTYECADQFFSSNTMMIEEYTQNPEVMLQKVGIAPGSYEHMVFEYHLRSKDVHGFFSTSNSAGSFMIMAVFCALGVVVEGYASLKAGKATSGEMAAKCIVLAAVTAGLFLTRSKGAIGAGLIALALLGIWARTRQWLARYKRLVVVSICVAIVAMTCAIVFYGTTRGTLPGGKSMLVRWQYWTGSLRMYSEHPLGVGGGNFSVYYPQYKDPAAPETIKDPHNFVLSFLTQYGPLGLIGFLAAVFGAVRLVAFGGSNIPRDATPPRDPAFHGLVWKVLPLLTLLLLIIRPMVLSYDVGTDIVVAAVVLLFLLVVPLVIFVAAWFLLSIREDAGPFGDGTQAILLCGVAGVLIHNCVDFAIFEPGVLSVFWAVVATCVAISFVRGRCVPGQISLSRVGKLLAWSVSGLALLGFVLFVLIPVPSAEWLMARATEYLEAPDSDKAHKMFAEATRADALNAEAPYSDGRLYLFDYMAAPDPNLIQAAREALAKAIDRNPAYYKYYAKLAEVYATAAQTSQGDTRTELLERAYQAAADAIDRYPGDAALHITFADIADGLGRKSEALANYIDAVAIEDAYREQFRRMYKDRELYSRLGEKKYQDARSRIAELSAGTN